MPDPIAVIVLAAGGSTRLGRPKQLVRIDGQTLVRRAAEAALACKCGPVIVVLGAAATACRVELAELDSHLRLVENADWQMGIAGSIRTGVAAAEALSVRAAILMTCDQPQVDARVLRQLIDRHGQTGAKLVASAYGGTLGVPALFHRNLFSKLLALDGDRGAKAVIESHGLHMSSVPFPGGECDVDTIADVERSGRAGIADTQPPN